jgi:hypothetical protein
VKQYISKFLKTLAAFFLAFPLLYIVIAATLFDIPLDHTVGILLSPFYYLVSILVLVVGYGFWEMRRWSWYLFILSQVLLTYENAILVQRFSESHNKLLSFGVSVLLQLALIYRVAQEIRVPYFLPKIRWWESNQRYRLSVPVILRRKSGETLEGTILDLSNLGCFVKLRNDLPEGEQLGVDFSIFGMALSCDGTAVWSAESTVTHPRGVGIKFSPSTKAQKKMLRLIQKRLRKIGLLYKKFRYLLTEDDFLKKLEEIESGAQISLRIKSK